MGLDASIFIDYGPQILEGFRLTVVLVVLAVLLGLPAGVLLAFAKRSKLALIRWPAVAYLEVIRNTPFMIQAFLLFYVLPFYGVRLPADVVGVLALAMFGSVYYAEIVRAGIDAVPRGQLQSARAVGMSGLEAMRYVVLPQSLPMILPPLANQTLSLVKESAILSTITVQEMTMAALRVQGETFRPFEVFVMVAALYWLLNETIATGIRYLERRTAARGRARSAASLGAVGGALSLRGMPR
jgi:polar amino acid transport system permease protein